MTTRILALLLLYNLVYHVSAQGGLPDSISNTDCLTLQMNLPHVCCEPDTGNFCQIQCNNGICQCVDQTTGVPLIDITFSENDESIDCSLIIPDPPEITTEPEPATTTDDEGETSNSFSDSDSTNRTRSSGDSDSSGDMDSSRSDSSRSNTTRSNTDRSRSDSSRSNGTRSDTTDGSGDMSSRDRSDSTGRSGRDRSNTNNTRSDTTGRGIRCPTVSQLLADDECVLSCVVEDDDGCPECNDTCFNLVPSGPPASDTPCNCAINQVCLRVGRFGEFRCVDLLLEGERCDSGRNDDDDEDKDDEDGSGDMDRSDKDKKSRTKRDVDETSDSSALRKVGGARDRRVFGDLGGAAVGCQEGLVCTPVSIGRSECLPENPNGPCVIARQQGLDIQCSPDGAFEPLQVKTDDEDDLYHVVCVQPTDGSPISGTELIVADMDDAPDCDRLVGCSVERGGQNFDVPHGDFFIYVDDDDDDDDDDDNECQRCLCSNGEATLCESANCTAALRRAPLGCSYQGQSYSHGDSFDVDCNRCGCNNGQIRCTRAQCDDSEITDRCQECLSEPLDQVCGINGVTYASPCAAVYCAGLAPFDFFRGACPSLDVCALYPCGDGETCLRKGGTTCFDSDGCDPDDLRLCVDPNSLVCDDDDDDDDDEVCATNGVTYPSLCRLLQDTGNEAVAYAGECDREECEGGKVCGSDGETYDNICVLRSQSANARVDYDGECDDDLDDIIEEICERVNRTGRCSYNSSNCRYLVNPEEGCCALCGGVIFVAMDLTGLREYVRINPSVRTLDDFIEVLVDSDFIDDEITEKCELEASLTMTGNIQITLSARTDDDDGADARFCNAASETIAATINDLSLVPQSAQVPEVLQFASAALAAPNTATTDVVKDVVTVDSGVNEGVNGAPVLKALSYFTVLLLVVFSFVLF